MDVPPVRARIGSEYKIIEVGQGEPLWDLYVEAGDVNDKKDGGDWGALGSSNGDRGKALVGALEEEAAGPVCKEEQSPRN